MVIEDIEVPHYTAEDQQAQSSKIENMGGSSGGPRESDDILVKPTPQKEHLPTEEEAKVNSPQKPRFMPNIISYEEPPRDLKQQKVFAPRNPPDPTKPPFQFNNSAKLNNDQIAQLHAGALAINRNNMVFGQQKLKEYIEQSLSHINSVENISVQSCHIIDVSTNKRIDTQLLEGDDRRKYHQSFQIQNTTEQEFEQLQLNKSIDQLDQLDSI